MDQNNDALDKELAAENSKDLLETALESLPESTTAQSAAVNNVEAAAPVQAAAAQPEPVAAAPAAPVQKPKKVTSFDDPGFWTAFYATLNSNMKENRIPKFFAISKDRAEKFLNIAKANFKDFEEKNINSLDDLSFNIVSEDNKQNFTLFVISSDFIKDPPGQDGGQFF